MKKLIGRNTKLPGMHGEQGYTYTRAIGRDRTLEATLQLHTQAPSEQQWQALSQELTRAAETLGAALLVPARPDFVLSEPLSRDQREALDKFYVPLYAKALEADEEPRERMEYRECHEVMADLRAAASAGRVSIFWSSRPFAAACGNFAGKPRIFWARESVAARFMNVTQALNSIGLAPQVEDGYRPPEVQAGLYRARVKAVREEQAFLSEEEVLREARAKTACAPYRAAHMGGAAIDFTLRDLEGRPLDLGNPYPTGGAATVLCFPYVTWEQFRTRQLFSCISRMAGLLPYPGEDWHVSCGDGLAALMTGESVVRFGPLRDFDRSSGAVLPYEESEARTFFSS